MSSAISTRSALTISAVTVVGGLIAYAAYFDYKRRNDPTFRKRLRKEKKRAERSKPEVAVPGRTRSIEEIKEALAMIRDEPLPATGEEKEQYFMDNVQMGEQLCAQGPMFEIPAALSFYRALRVYPSPVELIMIYQKTVPEPVFKIVMEMTSLDVKQRAEGYFDAFPGPFFDVTIAPVPLNDGPTVNGEPMKKNVLIAGKDFAVGDVIYKEQPIVATLDSDLEGKGTHCSQCFRHIAGRLAIHPEKDLLNSTYCSKECELQASTQHHALLFGATPSILVDTPLDATKVEARKQAQKKLADCFKDSTKSGVLLVARFIARVVADETKKLAAAATAQKAKEEYSLMDHIERLRFLEFSEDQWKEQKEIAAEVLRLSAGGLEAFLNDDRYGVLLGKMAYNVIGVSISGGRDDKPESKLRIEDQEWTRTPSGTKRQVGSGLYFVSSYLSHSCSPNVRPSFVSGTNELHLIANEAIRKGDELTMAYVNIQLSSEEPAEALEFRRTRRQEIARGWRFACTCTRCVNEAPPPAAVVSADAAPAVDDVRVEGRGAQTENSVTRFETGTSEAEFRTTVTNDADVE